jgi:outer membrane biogenesis lipoprotein LolB
MKMLKLFFALLALLAVGILAGCSTTAAKSPDVSDSIRKSLDQSGFKDVSVSQDRDKGVVESDARFIFGDNSESAL